MSARFTCDCRADGTPLPHFWEHTVGSDHALMALRADWRAQLARAHEELGFRHVRFHGLFDDDMGTLVCEQDKLVHSFFNADSICDFLVSIGMKPFVELSFMPSTLASGGATVFKYRGNVTPPRDVGAWTALVERLVRHWIDRYGSREVRTWPFGVWNEPNLRAFWTGSQADYFELYRRTACAIKEVDGRLRVGGPATADNAWIKEFVDFCGEHHAPLDFVSTHHYPTDSFGKPGDDTATQLAASRRSVLRDEAREVRPQAGRLPLYYTEWSSSSNPRDALHDEPYAAAFAVKTILEAAGIVDAYSWWTFSDIFEENYFPAQPFHGGFGLLNLQSIAKPTYRAFQVLHDAGDELLATEGEHPTVDAWVVRDDDRLTIIVTNWALPRHEIATERVTIVLDGAGRRKRATLRRIDARHANAKSAWQRLGAPEYPSAEQCARLARASELRDEPCPVAVERDRTALRLTLAPQAVAVVTLEARRASTRPRTRGITARKRRSP